MDLRQCLFIYKFISKPNIAMFQIDNSALMPTHFVNLSRNLFSCYPPGIIVLISKFWITLSKIEQFRQSEDTVFIVLIRPDCFQYFHTSEEIARCFQCTTTNSLIIIQTESIGVKNFLLLLDFQCTRTLQNLTHLALTITIMILKITTSKIKVQISLY